MKKYLSILLTLLSLCVLAAGCSDGDAAESDLGTQEVRQTDEPTAAPGSATDDADADNSNAEDGATSNERPAAGVDVDLTAMSSTMVYAEVNNMIMDPDSYVGKTIKVSGAYTSSFDETTDQNYHFVLVADALACCQQGLEFKWNGDHSYPDDYPEENETIEIVGEFGFYDDMGESYQYLSVDDVLRIPAEGSQASRSGGVRG